MEGAITDPLSFRKGEVTEGRSAVIRVAAERLQAPPPDVRRRIEAMDDLELFRDLNFRVSDATSWEALLAGAGPEGGLTGRVGSGAEAARCAVGESGK